MILRYQTTAVFAMLAIGFSLLWIIIVAGGSGVLYSLLFAHPQDHEEAIIDADNRILIQTRLGVNPSVKRYRTLEGEEVAASKSLSPVAPTISTAIKPPRLVHWPIPWNQRVAGLIDHGNPPLKWALIRNADMPGRAFFAGYDTVSNLPIGYIGLRGIDLSIPLETDQFDVGNHLFRSGSNVVASLGGISYGQLPFLSQILPEEVAGWIVFIKNGNSICEINLRDQTVREVVEIPELLGFAITKFHGRDSSIMPSDPILVDRGHQLVARAREHLVLLNSLDESQVEFKLPQNLIDKSIQVRVLDSDRIMIQVYEGNWKRGRIAGFITITPDGGIENKETVRLVGGLPADTRLTSLMNLYVSPTTALWILESSVFSPFRKIQAYQTDTYVEAVGQAVGENWPALAGCLLLSTLLTAIVYRWQQKYSRPNTPLWTTLVFLTTVPGFLAYWAMHRRPPLAACSHCGKEVPHNRDACARCAEPFPEPKLLGTEVFN